MVGLYPLGRPRRTPPGVRELKLGTWELAGKGRWLHPSWGA